MNLFFLGSVSFADTNLGNNGSGVSDVFISVRDQLLLDLKKLQSAPIKFFHSVDSEEFSNLVNDLAASVTEANSYKFIGLRESEKKLARDNLIYVDHDDESVYFRIAELGKRKTHLGLGALYLRALNDSIEPKLLGELVLQMQKIGGIWTRSWGIEFAAPADMFYKNPSSPGVVNLASYEVATAHGMKNSTLTLTSEHLGSYFKLGKVKRNVAGAWRVSTQKGKSQLYIAQSAYGTPDIALEYHFDFIIICNVGSDSPIYYFLEE